MDNQRKPYENYTKTKAKHWKTKENHRKTIKLRKTMGQPWERLEHLEKLDENNGKPIGKLRIKNQGKP